MGMSELADMGKVCITTVVSLFVLFLVTKLIGNQQISQLNMFDYINGITIGSIAAELSTNLEDYHKPLTALILYGIATFLIAYCSTKSIKLRRIIEGHSYLLYRDGELYRKNLSKCRMDVDEFLTMCRCQGYFNLQDIHSAYFEPNGQLSILPKSTARPVTPDDLNLMPNQEYPLANIIIDGKLLPNNLKACGKDEHWLQRQLHEYGIHEISEVMLACYNIEDRLTLYIKLDRNPKEDIFD